MMGIKVKEQIKILEYQIPVFLQVCTGNQSKGTRYFHIPLKLVGDAGNVASNKFFKVSATITGEGSPNPDEILENACINFSIEVAPWNVVEQTEDDTN